MYVNIDVHWMHIDIFLYFIVMRKLTEKHFHDKMCKEKHSPLHFLHLSSKSSLSTLKTDKMLLCTRFLSSVLLFVVL